MATRVPASARRDQVEGAVLAVILAVVAGAAGWASFTHVHDWTMRHSPTNTPDAFGWVNAAISELVPAAAFLVIKRRRRAGAPIGYPLVLLIAAAGLSLAAQLAVAQRSPSGWLLSAVPALAFMALVKLIVTGNGTPPPTTADQAEPVGQVLDVDQAQPEPTGEAEPAARPAVSAAALPTPVVVPRPAAAPRPAPGRTNGQIITSGVIR